MKVKKKRKEENWIKISVLCLLMIKNAEMRPSLRFLLSPSSARARFCFIHVIPPLKLLPWFYEGADIQDLFLKPSVNSQSCPPPSPSLPSSPLVGVKVKELKPSFDAISHSNAVNGRKGLLDFFLIMLNCSPLKVIAVSDSEMSAVAIWHRLPRNAQSIFHLHRLSLLHKSRKRTHPALLARVT